jgi:alanine-synthesizing transaminase
VLIPAPDYPLWTAAASLAGGNAVHYVCDEQAGWAPDLDDIRSKVTDRTRAIVVINPNNPTGAVYSEDIVKGLVDIARRHQLVVMADEIYEKIIFDDAVHHHAATFAGDDVLCLTFSGLSKAYRVCGYRAGWVMISGPRHLAGDFLEGLTLVANMRMCANVPAQHAIQTALGGYQSIEELIAPGGRFHEQSMLADRLLNEIPGVSSVRPRGALYCFPRLDPEVYAIDDDEAFVIDLLRAKRILVTHGTGFNWFEPDHFRLVTLPDVEVLTEAIGRISDFLATRR